MAANELQLTWEDEDGVVTKSRWYTDEVSLTPLAGLFDALKEVSEAALVRVGLLRTGAPATPIPAGSGSYDARDKVVFICSDTLGNEVKVSVPAPVGSIFSDSDNVNVTNADVIAWFDALAAIYESVHGQTLDSLIRGYRIRT